MNGKKAKEIRWATEVDGDTIDKNTYRTVKRFYTRDFHRGNGCRHLQIFLAKMRASARFQKLNKTGE